MIKKWKVKRFENRVEVYFTANKNGGLYGLISSDMIAFEIYFDMVTDEFKLRKMLEVDERALKLYDEMLNL